ncbi:hypothetical protein Pla52o_57350 [Novipirellula galeiformis]|uniref:Uncharacterized protein n=1 Tax=Novipirellula galeiformis TaxID=2528004 RepID=A0A5C6BG89_9BACT|nr:hypothetical protein Pla52o_57350 [Novipirellula galeiformis]
MARFQMETTWAVLGQRRRSPTEVLGMNERRRPIRVADLLWLSTFVALALAIAVPAYRFASDANHNVAFIPHGLVGPIGMLATICVILLPCLHLLLGIALIRVRGSIVTDAIALVILLDAIPSGFAAASIGRACAMQIAG